MSRQIKYLGSNCKPVIAETVEPNTQIQTHSSPKENTMTLLNNDKATTVESAASDALTELKVGAEQAVEIKQSVLEETISQEQVTIEPAPSALKQVGEAKKAAAKFSWLNVATAGAMTAINVGCRMGIENTLKEESEDRHSILNIALRTVAAATVSSGLQAGLQLAVKKTNGSDVIGMVAVAGVGNAVAVTDAFFGDSVQSMFSTAIGKGKSTIDSYLNKEEEVAGSDQL